MPPWISEITWAAIQTDWESGQYTERELAAKYYVSKQSIWQRRKTAEKRGNPWKRTATIIELPANGNPDSNTVGRNKLRRRSDMAISEISDVARDKVVQAVVQTYIEATQRHLTDASQVRDLMLKYVDAIRTLMDPGAGEEARSEAAKLILATKNDSLSGALTTVMRMAEGIQAMERKALGMEGKPSNGFRPGGPQSEESTGVISNDPETGKPVIDVTKMPSRHLEALRELTAMMEEQGRAGLPMPPQDPEDAR